jgi:lipid-A-disaccharide synthase
VRHYGGLWDRLLCLLPFEPAFFARHGLPATFVGHPVLESGAETGNAARFRARHGLSSDAKVLTVMPGSRRTEVARMLPTFGASLRLVAERVPGLVPAVPLAGPVAEAVAAGAARWPTPPILLGNIEDKHDAFAASAAALTKSGTSTLELAMAGVPMLVSQRGNPISVAIFRRMVTVPHLSILNLIAGREIVPELLQQDCTPERIAAALVPLLTDPAAAASQRAACRAVLAQLAPPAGTPGDGTPSAAAAAEVLALLDL